MKVALLFLISFLLILSFGNAAFKVQKQKYPKLTVLQFLNLTRQDLKLENILVGMVGGFAFGFIDNAGLWLGMDYLDNWFESLGYTNEMVKAGLGNTFSDVVGAFLSTFVSILVSYSTNIPLETTPIWANAIGILIGCLAGIAFGNTLFKH